MAQRGLPLALQFRDNALGEDLAQFHPPLIERVNGPDGALRETWKFSRPMASIVERPIADSME